MRHNTWAWDDEQAADDRAQRRADPPVSEQEQGAMVNEDRYLAWLAGRTGAEGRAMAGGGR